jgi:zinc D-Ala-D-Ala carboxypeptidase
MINLQERLSANFTLSEYLESATARKHNFTEQFNPPANIVANIRMINERIQVVRTQFGKPLRFTSGYRCPRLNTAVGGAKASEHLDALGVDISTSGMSQKDVIDLIEMFIMQGCKRIGLGRTFIHVGFSRQAKHPQNVVFDYQGAHATPAYLLPHRTKWISMMRASK